MNGGVKINYVLTCGISMSHITILTHYTQYSFVPIYPIIKPLRRIRDRKKKLSIPPTTQYVMVMRGMFIAPCIPYPCALPTAVHGLI